MNFLGLQSNHHFSDKAVTYRKEGGESRHMSRGLAPADDKRIV